MGVYIVTCGLTDYILGSAPDSTLSNTYGHRPGGGGYLKSHTYGHRPGGEDLLKKSLMG